MNALLNDLALIKAAADPEVLDAAQGAFRGCR